MSPSGARTATLKRILARRGGLRSARRSTPRSDKELQDRPPTACPLIRKQTAAIDAVHIYPNFGHFPLAQHRYDVNFFPTEGKIQLKRTLFT
jgi:hypothetical protein